MNTCRKGLHNLTDPANVLTKKDGSGRQCKACHLAAVLEREARLRSGFPTPYPRLDPGQSCEADGCEKPRHRPNHGRLGRYCSAHQNRWNRYGDLFTDVPIGYKPGKPLPESRAELAALGE